MGNKIEHKSNYPLSTPIFRPDAYTCKLKVIGETKNGFKIRKIKSIKKNNA